MNSFVPNVKTASISRHLIFYFYFLNHVHVRKLQFLLHGDSCFLLSLNQYFVMKMPSIRNQGIKFVHGCNSDDPQLKEVQGGKRELSHFWELIFIVNYIHSTPHWPKKCSFRVRNLWLYTSTKYINIGKY